MLQLDFFHSFRYASIMNNLNRKQIILCADDYGLNVSVSQGIVTLLERKRLSATSCLTNFPDWLSRAAELKPLQTEPIGIGLHFNLTEGRPLSSAYHERYGASFFSLSRLIISAFLHRLDVDVLEQECQAQLDHFVEGLGSWPDFIDGHQHVHQLPQVREAVLRVYERSLRSKKAYLRSVAKAVAASDLESKLKQALITSCGSKGFRRLLKKHAIPHNADFAGIYSFPEADHYSRILPRFLKKVSDQGLIMCHPGLVQNGDSVDEIAEARFHEYCYLASDQFLKDCEDLGVELIHCPD